MFFKRKNNIKENKGTANNRGEQMDREKTECSGKFNKKFHTKKEKTQRARLKTKIATKDTPYAENKGEKWRTRSWKGEARDITTENIE